MKVVLCVAGLAACVLGLVPRRASVGGKWALGFSPPAAPEAPEAVEAGPGEAFGKLAAEGGSMAGMMADLPPVVGNAASKSAVILGAVTSALVTPGPLIFSAVGAALGGGLVR